MNSLFVRTVAFAALLGAPLAGFGQVMHTQAGGGGTGHLTLLPGPYLTSTAISAGTSGPGTLSFVPDLAKIDAEIRATREKLRQLEAQREMALTRQKEIDGKIQLTPPLPANFNFNFGTPTPAKLFPQPTLKPAQGTWQIQRTDTGAKRD